MYSRECKVEISRKRQQFKAVTLILRGFLSINQLSWAVIVNAFESEHSGPPGGFRLTPTASWIPSATAEWERLTEAVIPGGSKYRVAYRAGRRQTASPTTHTRKTYTTCTLSRIFLRLSLHTQTTPESLLWISFRGNVRFRRWTWGVYSKRQAARRKRSTPAYSRTSGRVTWHGLSHQLGTSVTVPNPFQGASFFLIFKWKGW